MEEWLSGVTQLVDKSEDPKVEQITQTATAGNIVNHIEDLVKGIRKNQEAIEHLIKLQQKENEKDSR
jgi:hypothetical protein